MRQTYTRVSLGKSLKRRLRHAWKKVRCPPFYDHPVAPRLREERDHLPRCRQEADHYGFVWRVCSEIEGK